MRFEPRHYVASILLRREQTKLGAGTPGCSLNLRRPGENVLDDVELAVRFGQRRPARSPVVEHERAFVHFGKEPRAHESLGDDSGNNQNRGGGEHTPRMVQHALE